MWIVFAYIVVSGFIAWSALASGIYPAIATGLTVIVAIVGGSGLKGGMHMWRMEDVPLYGKLIGIAAAAVCLLLALWLGRGFSAQLFGYTISGSLYGLIGFVISFLFVPGRYGEISATGREL